MVRAGGTVPADTESIDVGRSRKADQTTRTTCLRRAAPYGVLRIIFVIVSAKRPEPAPQADRCPRSACAVFEMSQVHVQPVGIVVECQIVPGTTLYRAQQHRPPAVVC